MGGVNGERSDPFTLRVGGQQGAGEVSERGECGARMTGGKRTI